MSWLFVCLGYLCILAAFCMLAAAIPWPGGNLLFYMFKVHSGGVAPAVLPTLIPLQEEALTCTWRQMIVKNCITCIVDGVFPEYY